MSVLGQLILASATAVSQPVLACPETINDKHEIVSQTGAQEVRFFKGPRLLEWMRVFVGHPSKLQTLRGDDWTDKSKVVYPFGKPTEVWVECGYGGSSAILTYNLGKVRSCTYIKRKDLYGGGRGSCVR